MHNPSVFVIILNYNGKACLNDCLSSVFRSDYPNVNVVVVDNASFDVSFEDAKEKFSKAHFIKNSANIGFAKGNNIGIRFALEKFADYIFLLNNDAEIFSDTLSLLINSAEKHPRAGIVSPLIYGPAPDKVWFAGGTIDWLRMRSVHETYPKSKDLYATEYATGCAMLIKKQVFKKIGLFDEKFFLYYEDVDFSLRARKNNFSVMLLPTAKATHKEISNKKNADKIYWLVFSALIFFKASAPTLFKLWYLLYLPARKMKASFFKNPFSPQIRRAFFDFKNERK